jgi:ATPase family protein associated with various cellular activities (AAA)
MPELLLSQLRTLRNRAEELLRHVPADLSAFLHADRETFLRTPESRPLQDDVNVTTTCSCLMALALTKHFAAFYKLEEESEIKEKAASVLRKIVAAPWMSSGLTENNAFTTTLVLRTFGFLLEEGLLDREATDASLLKQWELHLGIEKPVQLAEKLNKHEDPTAEFLWLSLSDKARILFTDPETSKKNVLTALALDLRRIIQSGWIYETTRFPRATADMKQELERLKSKPTVYKLARVNHQLLASEYSGEIAQPASLSLSKIAELMATDPENFSINEYPPSAAVVYWFVDGIARAKITLKEDSWTKLCQWAVNDFNRQRSLAIAEHDAMMDPVAMAMAACLCARLRTISYQTQLGTTNKHLALLPSVVELEHSIQELFKKQGNSGIWPKYFPLFHYQDAGSNFCFTFELVEAVLYEFGRPENKVLDNPAFVEGLERAVTWCEKNYLKWSGGGTEYTGWNSGGYLETLKKGQPESWPTAVVHMFLCELHEVLGLKIQDALLKMYKAKVPETSWDKLIDVDVQLQSGTATTLKTLIEDQVIKHAATFKRKGQRKMEGRLSVLLFGPPGTSKTQLTRAVAARLNWPLVELDPSNFLSKGIENIYERAEEIFADLQHLSKVIVLFDEMDALVQTRGGVDQPLDVTSRFLTTSMLPKLASLHDNGKLIFFFATNYPENFDPAIKRPGRFDILLCVGPPNWKSKLEGLGKLLPNVKGAEREAIKTKLEEFTTKASRSRLEMLDLLTFTETQTFFESFAETPKGLPVLGSDDVFFNKLKTFSAYMTLRKEEPKKAKAKSEYQRFKEQRVQSQTQ